MTTERMYFCMDFIGGGSIERVLKVQEIFPEQRIKFYAMQMIIALDILHKNNIMHRDIKPDNLMIDSEGYLKMIDFGLARILNPNQLAYTQCGTPDYMSPEVVQGHNYSYSSEWWSVGIVIF